MTANEVLSWVRERTKGTENVFDTFERLMLDTALREADGHQTDAAEILGISSRVINYRLHKYSARPIDVVRIELGQTANGGGPQSRQTSFDWGSHE